MRGFILIFALVLGIQADPGHEILRGYMLAKDGSKCINTDDASGVADSSGATGMTPAELKNATCSLMSVKEGTTTGQYIVENQADSTKQITLSNGVATTFTSTGTQLTFTPEGTTTALTRITSADISSLTTMTSSVYVANVDDQVDNTDCLKLDGTYLQGTLTSNCAGALWYFVTAACTDTNCKTCNPDPATCSECNSDAAFNKARIQCTATTTESNAVVEKASLMTVIGMVSLLLNIF